MARGAHAMLVHFQLARDSYCCALCFRLTAERCACDAADADEDHVVIDVAWHGRAEMRARTLVGCDGSGCASRLSEETTR